MWHIKGVTAYFNIKHQGICFPGTGPVETKAALPCPGAFRAECPGSSQVTDKPPSLWNGAGEVLGRLHVGVHHVNLSPEQRQTHRYREQTNGDQWGAGRGGGHDRGR